LYTIWAKIIFLFINDIVKRINCFLEIFRWCWTTRSRDFFKWNRGSFCRWFSYDL